MPETKPNDGVMIDFIAKERLENMGQQQKTSEILDSVMDGRMVVLEEGLTPNEESELIQQTMEKISPTDDFNGIEIESNGSRRTEKSGGLMDRILGKNTGNTKAMTLIGPADRIETLDKKEDLLSTLVRK